MRAHRNVENVLELCRAGLEGNKFRPDRKSSGSGCHWNRIEQRCIHLERRRLLFHIETSNEPTNRDHHHQYVKVSGAWRNRVHSKNHCFSISSTFAYWRRPCMTVAAVQLPIPRSCTCKADFCLNHITDAWFGVIVHSQSHSHKHQLIEHYTYVCWYTWRVILLGSLMYHGRTSRCQRKVAVPPSSQTGSVGI